MKFYDFLLFFVMVSYIILCPYTKVEESFNIQATHNIIEYGVKDISKYDHLEFPGVVPRTFTGPLVLSAIVIPFKNLLSILANNVDQENINKVTGFIHKYISRFPEKINQKIFEDKFILQYATRIALTLLVVWSFSRLHKSIVKTWNRTAGNFMILLTLVQFHIPFWCSRTIPNTFALILVNLAYSYWILKTTRKPNNERRISERKRSKIVIMILVFTSIVFRSEVILLTLPIIFIEWKNKKIRLSQIIKTGILASLLSIIFTVCIDSYFWKKLVWPEGNAFYFNIINGGSSDYGVEPWYNYFKVHIPKMCLVSMVFAFYGFIAKERIRRLLIPAIFFVSVYSFLPHKETRFIFYVVPLINTAGAVGLSYIYDSRKFSIIRRLIYWIALLAIIANLFISMLMGYISSFNYPGGVALKKVNKLGSSELPIKIHLDVLTAQTGATKFGEINDKWLFDKDENLKESQDYIEKKYDYILTSQPSFHGNENWEIADSVEALSKISVEKDLKLYIDRIMKNISKKEKDIRKYLPIKIHTTKKIFILKRK